MCRTQQLPGGDVFLLILVYFLTVFVPGPWVDYLRAVFSNWLLFPDFAEILEPSHNPIAHGCSWN